MIKYLFAKKDNKIQKVKIQGHASYLVKNNDILCASICASVSTVIISTLNIIEVFKLQSKISFHLKEGYFFLKILDFNVTINKFLFNLEYTLRNLNQTYPEYFKEIKY